MEKLNEEFIKKAASYFRKGYNCAESVLMTMQEAWKMEEITPKYATGFGGGIGGRGSVCGAVNGSILAINLKYGRTKLKEDKYISYLLALDFYRKFEEKFGSAICYDLIKCDLTNPNERKKLQESNILEEKCVNYVKEAVKILLEMSEKPKT